MNINVYLLYQKETGKGLEHIQRNVDVREREIPMKFTCPECGVKSDDWGELDAELTDYIEWLENKVDEKSTA